MQVAGGAATVHVNRRGSVDITFGSSHDGATSPASNGDVLGGGAGAFSPSPRYLRKASDVTAAGSSSSSSSSSPHSPDGFYMRSFSPAGPSRLDRGAVGDGEVPRRRQHKSFSSSSSRTPGPLATSTTTATGNNKSRVITQRWVVQLAVGLLSAQDVLAASQVCRMWNHVVDSHLRLWHRLASFFSAWDADRIVKDPALSKERRQLVQVLAESCDFLRGVRVPRSAVLAHMRGSTKRLPPSVKLIARLVQLLLTPWLSLPNQRERSSGSTKGGSQGPSKKQGKVAGGTAFFENITSFLKDVPKTASYIAAAHRSFASRRRMILPLPRTARDELMQLSKRRQLLKPSRVPAPYRQLCEWTRAMLTCVRAAEQWRVFVIKHLKMPVLGALRRHAGFLAETTVPLMSVSSSNTDSASPALPPPPRPLLAGGTPSAARGNSPPRSPPPPPPESTRTNDMIAGYANRNYQYYGHSPSSLSPAAISASGRGSDVGISSPSSRGQGGHYNTGAVASVALEAALENMSSPVETAVQQLLSVIEGGRTLYGKPTNTPGGLFDAIDREGYGFVTRGQVKAALHRLDVELAAEIHFRELIEILSAQDREASRSRVVLSRESFVHGIMRLSWHLRPLSVMSIKSSWRLAGDLTAISDKSRSAANATKLDPRVWSAYMPLVRQLRDAVRHHRRVFGHEIRRICEYFEAIDTNGDGAIGLDEFRAALRRLDMGTFMDAKAIEDVFHAIDTDQSGTIDRAEFEAAMQASMTEIERGQNHGGGDDGAAQPSTRSVSTRAKRTPTHLTSPASSAKDRVFISATRRRTLFANESSFTVHNAKSARKSALKKEQQRYGPSAEKAARPGQGSASRASANRRSLSGQGGGGAGIRYPSSMSADDAKKIRSKLKAAAYTTGGVNWHKLFKYYDRDKSGAIEFDEFRQLLRSDAKISKSHLSDGDVKLLFQAIDVDGSGEVEWCEFDAWVHSKFPTDSPTSSPRRGERPASSGNLNTSGRRKSQQSVRAPSPARQSSPHRGRSGDSRRKHKGSDSSRGMRDQHHRAGNEPQSEAQLRVFNRLQALRREHEERLAAVEDQFSGEVQRLSSRVEDANNLRHRDLERAMDEMDDMRRRLIDAHKRSQDMLHARADEQIAQMEREKLADAAQYKSRIQRLETERVALAEAAVQANEMREELEHQKAAYRQLEIEHASELRDLMRGRPNADDSHAPSLNISEILNQHAAVEAQANATIATLRTEKDDLEETVGTLLEQLARQDEKLEAANRRADGFHSIEEELHAANTRVDDLFSMNEELKASNASAALSTKRDYAERQALMQQVRRLHEELDQHDSELKHLVTRLRKVVSPKDFQELIAGLKNERNADLSGNTKSGQRSRSPHSALNSPETLIKF